MADEVIKQKILLGPEIDESALSKLTNKVSTDFAKAVKTGLSAGIKAVGGDFKKVGQMYEQIVDEVGRSPVDLEGFPLPNIRAFDVAQTLGTSESLSKAVETMFAAGFAANQPHDFVRSATRNTFRANLAEQPTVMGLNVPLEEAARASRAEVAKEKSSKAMQALQARAFELSKRIQDPSLPSSVRLSLLQQLANVNQSMGRQSFVTSGSVPLEQSINAVQTAAEIRAQVAGLRGSIRDETAAAERAAFRPYSTTEAMILAQGATGVSTPSQIQEAISRIGGGMSATDRLRFQYYYGPKEERAQKSLSETYWEGKFRNSIDSLTEETPEEIRRGHAQWAAEQDALGRSTEQYWQVKRRNAVDDIVNRSVMDPEAKKYFQEWIKAQNKNTSSLKSLTTWIKSTSGMAVSGYTAGRIVGGVATDFMEGRTSWLADTQNPYSTKRDVMQQWGKKYGSVAGAGVGALIGSLFGPIGTFVGSAIGAAGTMIWAQHNIDQKKIADEYAKYSGNINIQRALYGNNIGYNAANAIQNSNLASAADVLSLNATSAMLPGAMAFGAVSEQQMVGMSYLPDYWRALMNRENPLDILMAYRENAKSINPALVPYITQMAGLPESLRGLAMADNFEQLYAHKDEWAGMDLQQFATAMQNTQDAIGRAAISQRQLNTQFLEQSQSTRGNGLGGSPVADLLNDLPGFGAAKAVVAEALSENIRFGDLNVYIDGVQAAKRELKVEDWNGQTIYTSGGA